MFICDDVAKKRKKSFKHFLKFASSDVVVVGQIKHLVKKGKMSS